MPDPVISARGHTRILTRRARHPSSHPRNRQHVCPPTAEAGKEYTSGGRLEIVGYGQTDGGLAGPNDVATHLVDYNYRTRCSSLSASCPVPSRSNGSQFPDIPNDEICGATGTCSATAPTFFDRYFLHEVRALTRTGQSTFSETMRWDLGYEWVAGAAGEPAKLWLRTVTPFGGLYGGSLSLGAMRFDAPQQGPMANRSDFCTACGVTEMKMFRVGRIQDQYGGLTEVVYTQPKPCPIATQTTPDATDDPEWQDFNYNTWSCFPRWYVPTSGTPGFARWNKWVVGEVIRHDLTGRSEPIVTTYGYPRHIDGTGNPGTPAPSKIYQMAWHADTNPLVPLGRRSWGEYRGFFEVTETVSVAGDTPRTTRYRFHRGMHGDLVSHGSTATKTVTVTSSLPSGHTERVRDDLNGLAGFEFESWVSDAAAPNQSTDVSGTITVYGAVVSQGSAAPWNNLYWYEPLKLFTRASGKYSLVERVYDTSGRLTQLREYGRVDASYGNTVDDNGHADDRCTAYSYTPAGVSFTQGLLARTQLRAHATCSTSGELLSDVSLFYDGAPPTTSGGAANNPLSQVPPSAGEPSGRLIYTGGGVVDDVDARTAMSFITETSTFENTGFESPPGWGRVATSRDARGHETSYDYESHALALNQDLLTAADNHNVKTVTVTNPAGHATISEYDVWGRLVGVTDPNARKVEACYDALGRTRYVYDIRDTKPGGAHVDSSCANTEASVVYTYFADSTATQAPPAVLTSTVQWAVLETRRVNRTSSTAYQEAATYTLYDGFARPVQTKRWSPGASGGVVVTTTGYGTDGRVIRQTDPFHSASTLDRVLLEPATVPRDHVYQFDFAGRPTAQIDRYNGTELRRTTTTYSGATTTTTVPYSGTNPYGNTTVTTDAYGRTLTVVTDSNGTPATTLYRYNMRGDVISRAQPGQTNAHTTTYNLLGWPIANEDNNAGYTTTGYFETGQPAHSVDAAGDTTYFSIDALGRRTASYRGAGTYAQSDVTANLLTAFTYDPTTPTSELGSVSTATSYQPPGVQAFRAQATAWDPAGRITNTRVWVNAADDPAISAAAENALDDPIDLGSSYTWDGLPLTTVYPGKSGTGWTQTANETVNYGYHTAVSRAGLLNAVTGTNTYVTAMGYTNIAELASTSLGAGSYAVTVNRAYVPQDGRLQSVSASNSSGTTLTSQSYVYDHAGMVTFVGHSGSGVANGECYYYDTKQRLTRGLTVATPTTACPTAPTDATASAGHAPFNESHQYELRDVFTTSAGRTYTYSANTPSIGVTCASGTETAKPDAVSSTTGTATHPQNKIWYECNGAMMSRSQTGAGVNNRISYAWDDGMRLEAVAQGTPVTWSTSTGGTASIAHRSSSSANSGASGASSLTISRPTGVAASDVLVAGIMVNSSTVTITPPAGWTPQTTVSNGSDNTTVVYTKVATASEPTSYGFTFSFNVKSAGAVSAYTGVNTSSPVNAVNTGTNAVQTNQVAPSVTTTAANTMVVRVWGTRKDTSVTPPAGVTERADTNSTGTGSVAIAIGDSTQPTAAASGTATATAATSGSGAHVTIALTPATTGGSGLVGVTVDANTNDLTTASTLDGTTYNAGAVSTQTLTGDGAVSFRIRGPQWFVGLNDTNTGGAGFAEIDYAIVIGSAGHVEVYEAGVLKCNLACSKFQNHRDSDLFSVQRTGNTITYLRNGRTFYTSTVPATAAGYYVDTSAASPNSRIGDVLISTGNSGIERHVYDVNGQRVLRIEPTGTKTIYLGTTELRWTPTNSSVVQVARYYPGGTERGFDGTVRYAVHGHQGSLLATINATSGAITHNRYLPYGTMRAGTSPNDKGFLGQTTDNAINLIYLNNRYHDPQLGVFISVDPLVQMTGEPYIYASGNPTTLSDPSGLCSSFTTNRSGAYTCTFYSPGGTTELTGDLKTGDLYDFELGCDSTVGVCDGSVFDRSAPQDTTAAEIAVGFVEPFGSGLDVISCGRGVYNLDLGGTASGCGALAVPFGSAKLLDEVGGAAGGLFKRLFGGGAEVCGLRSFSADTEVLMADGTTKPISQIEIGDMVLAYDPVTGEHGPREVTHLWVHQDRMLDLELDGAHVTTTEDHPFWNATDRAWQDAQLLDAGDLVLTADGSTIQVDGLDWSTTFTGTAYNFTVDDIHTYYVQAGEHEILVHNTGCDQLIHGTRGLSHSFDEHASQWFGRNVSRSTHMDEWAALVERTAGSSQVFEWSTGSAATIAHLARIDGKYFAVQFFADGPRAGELATAFVPGRSQLTRMLAAAAG